MPTTHVEQPSTKFLAMNKHKPLDTGEKLHIIEEHQRNNNKKIRSKE